MNFKNKNFYLIGSAVVLAGLIFTLNAPLAKAGECSSNNNEAGLSFFKFLNPLASLAEKVVKDFGYEVALAIAPDLDFCGSDTYTTLDNLSGNPCTGGAVSPVRVSWEAQPLPISNVFIGNPCDYPTARSYYYSLIVPGVRVYDNIGINEYIIPSSDLSKNTPYTWSVEVHWGGGRGGNRYWSSRDCAYTDQPHGSFTTSNCAPAVPDMIVTALNYSGTLTAGNSISFSGTIKNNGAGSAVASNARFCVDNANCTASNKTGIVGDPVNDLYINTLAAGSSQNTNPTSAWTAVAGNHTVTLCADVWNHINNESDETNNCSTVSFSIGGVVTYLLTVTKAGTGSGTVTSNPLGINCGSDCTENYTSGTSVTLTASAASGSQLTAWSGCDLTTGTLPGTTGTCTVSMTQNRNVTATFNTSAVNPPTAPSVLTATPGCDGTSDANMSLTWTDNATNEDGYYVYRSTTSGFIPSDSNKIASLPANSSSYTDSNPALSTTYYYKVRAYNAGGSADSNQAQGTTTNCPASNQAPNTALDIQNFGGSSITSTDVGTTVYLYVGGSSDSDGSISTVKFCSDDTPGNGTCDSSWSSEYSWTTSSGSWNTTTKKMSWSFSTFGNKGVYAQVKDNSGAWDATPAEDTITVNAAAGPTLSVIITANPMSGVAPLNTTLTANVSGTAAGNINYSFWWNCDNDTTNIAVASIACGTLPIPVLGTCAINANGAECDVISSASQSVNHIYSSTGSYRPKVIVERDAASPAQDLTDSSSLGLPNSPDTPGGPGGPGEPSCTVNCIIVNPPSNYTLTVTKAGTGSGTVISNPAGINCGSDCSESYTSGTSVTLTASAASGSTFAGWSGDADCSDGNVTMNAAKTCTATFNVIPPDFSLNSSNTIYATLVQGQAGESTATTLTISPFYGFSSSVSLSVQSVNPSLPAGTTYYFSDSTLTSSEYSAGSQFKVNIGSGLSASQTYTITIKGVDGGLVRTTNVLLNAQVQNPNWREI